MPAEAVAALSSVSDRISDIDIMSAVAGAAVAAITSMPAIPAPTNVPAILVAGLASLSNS